jgi:hypothetical protein
VRDDGSKRGVWDADNSGVRRRATCVSLCIGQAVEGLRIVAVVVMTKIAIVIEIAIVKMRVMIMIMMALKT